MMFNNCKLPLNKAQKLQRECSRKVENIKHSQAEDMALLTAYINGNDDAGFELFKSYKDIVSYIYRNPEKAQFKNNTKMRVDWTPMEKEDLFQEIALQFFKLVSEYDPEVGEFVGIVKGKLHLRVYDNFFEDVADQRFNETAYDEEIDFEGKSQSILLDESQHNKHPAQYIELYEAFNRLSKRQREAVELKVTKGWNAREVAEEMGISHSSARTHIELGLKKLKTLMGA
jgi:RNA polymerase sigma factor (sigma-70 family)